MTPEQATALIVALSGLVAALGVIYKQVRDTHALVDGRMAQLLDTVQLAGQKTGELQGRDFEKSSSPADASAKPPGPTTS